MSKKPKTEAKTGSEIVASAQKRLEEKGGSRFPTLTLSPAETDLWERLIAQDSGDARGKAKRTLMRALHALDGRNEPSDDELLAMLKARLK